MSNDIIDLLAETPADLADLRRRRPEAVENAQRSFAALFEPTNPTLIAVSYTHLTLPTKA